MLRFVDDVTKMSLPDESVDVVVDKVREMQSAAMCSWMHNLDHITSGSRRKRADLG